MDAVTEVFRNKGVKRIIIFGLIILILFSVRSMMNLILLTFIFSFLMNRLVEFMVTRIRLNHKLLVILNFIESIISSEQIKTYLENGFSFILKSFTDISKTSVQVLIALILSLFFLL